MPVSLLAKKRAGVDVYQTLAGHTEDALIVLSRYLREHRPAVQRLVDEQNLPFTHYCQILFFALFLHDIGKATREFQERLVKEELSRELSHTFFSLPLVETDLPPEYNLLVRILVLTHHTQPFDHLYYSFELLPRVNYLTEQIKDYLQSCQDLHARYFKDIFPLSARPVFRPPAYIAETGLRERLQGEVARLQQGVSLWGNAARTKALYCFAITLLKYCDSQASRAFHQAALTGGTVCGSLLRNVVNAQDRSSGPYHLESAFDRPALNRPPFAAATVKATGTAAGGAFLLLLAPPGSGRMTLALARAVSLGRERCRKKLVWICPGQIASGFTRHQVTRFWGAEQVALVHAASYYGNDPYLWGLPQNNYGRPNGTATNSRESIFACPVTVATMDHLVFSLVHGLRQADYILGNLMQAVVIIDGLPEPSSPAFHYTLDALALLRKMEIPHIILETALAPALKKYLADAGYVVEDHVAGHNKPLFELIRCQGRQPDLIREYYRLGLRQVVYTPSAREARQITRELKPALPGCPVFLYHSLFIHGDRDRLEREMLSLGEKPGPWLLIIGGDIDPAGPPECDVVHTGSAGPTILLRHSYPLWRTDTGPQCLEDKNNGCRGPGVLVLHSSSSRNEPESHSFNPALTQPLSVTPGYLEAILEEEYSRNKHIPTNLEEIFRACTLFGYSPREVRYAASPLVNLWQPGKRLIDVIPAELWQEELLAIPAAIGERKVKVPAEWYSRHPQLFSTLDSPRDKIILCHLAYDPERGLELPENG
ncbi:CRISPR-associated endonuclease Cas3'' [Desulfofundulus sp. TPOSR]|jgi:CRISPR-associated endonuclease/helicase Cas3|uniref:CRISPR-associated endonuclease Cas3'' n=1 Tax=Desulfofundulus sp. TPOSR TaxID=2714340 RepID=UPI00140CF24D|nr:CRISPR-associated endonuclease Cas3'' [Desulfofundulus sp. TPOSR]NHM27181.1 CRISPR-associated endonuclease Cas3'' [Desulfofundulus sp. TPOSR]